MNKEYVVLEGKIFVVELLSCMGSTNYGWCISKLPQQIIVMGTDNVPVGGNYSATVLQRFYFGALSTEEEKADISFTLNNWSDLDDVTDEFTVNVKIIKSDSEEFASYSENAVKVAMPYGLVRSDIGVQNSRQDYGLPYGKLSSINPSLVAYGVPCNSALQNGNMVCDSTYEGQGANFKYGYPCDLQQANYKYGYPCSIQEANFKYGYPCSIQQANYKYGYPCSVQEANFKYGYPCSVQEANFKYGYPCSVQEANFKYGYPCDMQETNFKYGYPCSIQKYGYPCSMQEATSNYGNANEARIYGVPF